LFKRKEACTFIKYYQAVLLKVCFIVELLKDKIIFLTGGSEGIGYECAKAYAAEGANVAIAALNEDRINGAVHELGASHLGIYCDVSIASDVKNAIEKTLQCYGRIDAIHNNAGIATPSKPLHQTTDEEWNNLMNVNLKGTYHTIKYGFEALRNSQGCILNTSSLAPS
jgi:NAD(P)-dependent dehydrogenase (short-subunit alcohol dehydrogenase family)